MLALVLVIALLLSATIITFSRRAVIDTMIVRNRDAVGRAESLARGGLRLAQALLVQDRFAKQIRALQRPGQRTVTPGNTPDDFWNQVGDYDLIDEDGGRLTFRIRDAGGLLNLNAVVPYRSKASVLEPDTEEFLVALLEKVIDEMPGDPGERVYDPRELARNLIDYVDRDEQRVVGGPEEEYYLAQDPPRRPANRPLLSVEEIGLIEGFDVQLMQAMRHYVTVYPVVGGTGINMNTAAPHVLALIYHGVGGSRRLADEGLVGRILKLRDEGGVVCTKAENPVEGCVTLTEVGFTEGSIFPTAVLPDDSDSFTVVSRGQVGDIERTLFAVLDRSDLLDPQLLFWRMK